MMRKRVLSFVLPLLLLSQQGALWHEIGHLRGAPSPTEQKQQPLDKLCETCLAFAHLAAAATPGVAPLALPDFSHALPKTDAVPFVAADAPSQRSRGPPAFL